MQQNGHPIDWEAFKVALFNRFFPRHYHLRVRDQLAALWQQENVKEYINKFTELMTRLPSMHVDDAIDRFIRGLKPHLQVDVLSRDPQTLESAFHAAVVAAARQRTQPDKFKSYAIVNSSFSGRCFRCNHQGNRGRECQILPIVGRLSSGRRVGRRPQLPSVKWLPNKKVEL